MDITGHVSEEKEDGLISPSSSWMESCLSLRPGFGLVCPPLQEGVSELLINLSGDIFKALAFLSLKMPAYLSKHCLKGL
jgi:hypothetical protein